MTAAFILVGTALEYLLLLLSSVVVSSWFKEQFSHGQVSKKSGAGTILPYVPGSQGFPKAVGRPRDLLSTSTGQHSVTPSHPAAQSTHYWGPSLAVSSPISSLRPKELQMCPWGLILDSTPLPKWYFLVLTKTTNKNLPGVQAPLPPLLQVAGAGDFSKLPPFPTSM